MSVHVHVDVADPKRRVNFNYRSEGPIEPIFHSHTQYEVYYFHEGKCNYLIGDQIYSLSPGDLIVMNGMTLHCAKIDRSVRYIRSIIHFDPAILRPYLLSPTAENILKPFQELKNYRIGLRDEEKAEAERILSVMNRHKSQGDAVGKNRMELAFLDLLYFIYEQCLQPMRGIKRYSSDKEKTVQRIVTLLESSYKDDLHMDRLQQEVHLSKSYLARLFKEVTGVTIFEYVYRKRINEARVIFLMNRETSVTEACFRLGFKHLAHFSRLFKRYVGLSPEQYKKQILS